MRKRLFILALLIFLSFALNARADIVGRSDEQIRRVAEPIIKDIIEGFKKKDYVLYSKDFAPALKETVSQKSFLETDKQIEAKIGTCTKRKYLGFLNQGKVTMVLWKASFDRTEDDILIRLVLSRRGDKTFVVGLWFQ